MAGDSIKPLVRSGEDLATALNAAGWLSDEVKAAAILRQGHSPSMLATISGVGLLGMLRGRSDQELPRTFVLAVTGSDACVFRARGVTVDETDYYVTIWSDRIASWPRQSVPHA